MDADPQFAPSRRTRITALAQRKTLQTAGGAYHDGSHTRLPVEDREHYGDCVSTADLSVLQCCGMDEPSVLIIGAGIGGLSTGCFAQMNGYRTTILEMHSSPGGVCTAWQRNGYTFDGAIHNLAGTTPHSEFYNLWRELGVVPNVAMHAFPELVTVERPDGQALTLHTDLDRLERHLKELAPADATVIEELITAARQFARHDALALVLAAPGRRLRALRILPLMLKYGRVTLEEFAQRFSDPFLRRAFPTLIYDWPHTPLTFLLSFLGRAHLGDLGWPMGGSLVFARAIEARFRQLGGQIDYHARVRSILVENDQAVGVRLADGTERRARYVVSNANGYATIYRMLEGRYVSPAIRAYYGAPEDRIEMGIHVSLGIARDLSAEPHAIVLPLRQPLLIAGELRHRLYVEPFGFDPSLAPKGKGVLKVMIPTSFAYWERLHQDPARYQAEKQNVAETVIAVLDERFPKLAEQVEVVDVATPMTTLRITGNGHGYRAQLTSLARTLLTGKRLSQTLPGLRNFFMVGQWAGIGGVPMVAAMGRDVAREICRQDRQGFISTPKPQARSA